jgi:hypothetical protein
LYPQIVMQRLFGRPLPTAKLNFVSTRSVAACDTLGLGFILDPLQCRYDPSRDAQALCSGGAGNGVLGTSSDANCVNLAEAQAVNRMWYGQTADGTYADPQADNAAGPYPGSANHLWFGLARGTSLGLLAGSAAPFTISSDVVALSLQDPTIAHTNFFNATGNGQAKWKDLSFAQLADAYARGLALQREFSFINTDNPDLRGLRRA